MASTFTFSSTELIENRRSLFILGFLALGAIILVLWQGLSFLSSQLNRAELQRHAVYDLLTSLQQSTAERLGSSAIALNIVAQSPSMKQYANQPAAFDDSVENLFKVLIESNPDIYQVRYIDSSGQEKIRVDKQDGQLNFVMEKRLQDKEKRYYFKETLGLTAAQFYVSRFDLNMEHGIVEIPWKPTIRLATPVLDRQSQTKGILIINLHGHWILEAHDSVENDLNTKIYLVNQKGFWISGKPKDMLWGFMSGKSHRFPDVYPDLWERVISTESGRKINRDDAVIYLPSKIEDVLPRTLTYSNPNQILWYAVVPQQSLRLVEFRTLLPVLIIIIVLLILSWSWAKSLSEQRKTEKELLKSEKLSSLAKLVAGVAHELNTPIGSALTIASTLEEKAKVLHFNLKSGRIVKSELYEFITSTEHVSKVMSNSLNRAAELIGHFKQVAVDQTGEQRRSFNLNEYIEELSATFNHLFRHRQVELVLQLKDSVTLDSYPGALSQVIINLVQNALIHGFDENDLGQVIVSTNAVSESRTHPNRVEICIIDNGKGIPDDVVERVFEPFFTTRLGKGGSGLGLYITYDIVTKILGGTITVVSDRKQNFTCFTVLIPCRAPDGNTVSKAPVRRHDAQRSAA